MNNREARKNKNNRYNSNKNGFLQGGLNAIEGWVNNGIDASTIEFAEKLGIDLAENGVTTSQIRNIYGEVTRLNLMLSEENYSSVLMLKPKLAYASVRSKSKDYSKLSDFLSKGIEVVDSGINFEEKKKKFSQLTLIFEAIVAYHKAKSEGDK